MSMNDMSMVDVSVSESNNQSASSTVDDEDNESGEAEINELTDETVFTPLPTFAYYLSNLWSNHDKNAQTLGHHKKAKLGTLLGVYLPSIQHTLNVQMFLRLLWIVGVAGVLESFCMVFICCFCIFLTTISLSAIATNENVKGGGAYFMISRNLGSEFGGAIGILYFVANALATALHLIGGIEILLLYIAPQLPHFGTGLPDVESHGDTINNFRIYASVFLLLEFVICALGVKFVQIFAPLSLICVILSILSVYIGAVVKNSTTSPTICMLGDFVLRPDAYADFNDTLGGCNKSENGLLWTHFCVYNDSSHTTECEKEFLENQARLVIAFPGLLSGQTEHNVWPGYMEAGEASPGAKGNDAVEVVQDMSSNFFHLLAIFFPCVTDIMTGANMSGDLKNPRKSLPIGTIAAQLTTSFIYLSLIFVYGGSINGSVLCDKFGASLNYSMVAAELAWPSKWVVLVGSFTATFGAALQCLCCAPRILQSIANDEIIPWLKVFSKLTKHNEPLRALILSTLIAELAILIGGVDHLSPIVDFFFLISYFSVNFACALQSLLGAPNWRPTFKYFHWSLSLLGAGLCVFIMFGTHWYYSIGVIILAGAIYKYIEYYSAETDWGEGIRSLALSSAQYSLLRINNKTCQHKFWRPQIMVMIKLRDPTDQNVNVQDDLRLLDLANQFKKGRGLTLITSMIDGSSPNADTEREKMEKFLNKVMEDKRIMAFKQVLASNRISEDVRFVIECSGIGALRANTILVGWPKRWRECFDKNDDTTMSFYDSLFGSKRALVVAKCLTTFPATRDKLHGCIDVWIKNQDHGVMLMMAMLLKRHRVWRSCKLRVFIMVDSKCDEKTLKGSIKRWLENLRIKCEWHLIQAEITRDELNEVSLNFASRVNKLVAEHMKATRLVVLELPKAHESKKSLRDFFEFVEVLTSNLSRVLLIRGNGENVLCVN